MPTFQDIREYVEKLATDEQNLETEIVALDTDILKAREKVLAAEARRLNIAQRLEEVDLQQSVSLLPQTRVMLILTECTKERDGTVHPACRN